jgi:hypothetical protein
MSDDSFIREVDEELRQDRAKALWQRYGAWIISGAIGVVLITGAVVFYQNWTQGRADASGDAFLQALALVEEGEDEAALAALAELESNGHGAYPILARLRTATLQAGRGDIEAALAGFDAVAADSSTPAVIRELARLRAAYLLVDHGSREDVASRVESLTGDAHPLRHSAREALGLAAWKAGDYDNAGSLFQQIVADASAPLNLRQRAGMMVELVRGLETSG